MGKLRQQEQVLHVLSELVMRRLSNNSVSRAMGACKAWRDAAAGPSPPHLNVVNVKLFL